MKATGAGCFWFAALAAVACGRAPAHSCTAEIECGVGWSCVDNFCQQPAPRDGGAGADDAGLPEAGSVEAGRDVPLRDSPWNFMFVTSKAVPVWFPTLDVADDVCAEAAAAGGLPGRYRAWLSTTQVDARDRLQGARGWIRPDGQPFADTIDDLTAGRIFNPPFVTELGLRKPFTPPKYLVGTGTNELVLTGTTELGRLARGMNCDDWSMQGSGRGGATEGTTVTWTYHPVEAGCFGSTHLYCFGVDKAEPLPPVVPAEGKRAFLSHGSFTPGLGGLLGGGLPAADGLCADEAAAAGLSGRFVAALATSTSSVAARFAAPVGTVWVRLDGIPLNAPGTDLFAGNGIAPLNVTSQKAYADDQRVWLGSKGPRDLPMAAMTCDDWRTTAVDVAAAVPTMTDWLRGDVGFSCFYEVLKRIYCLED